MVDVDFDKIIMYSDELVEYEDVLPLLIRAIIITKWSRKLNSKGLYVEINKRCVESKPHTYEEAVTELQEWCKRNPEYGDIIIR